MSGIFALIRRDLAHATRNTMAVVVLVGLSILPSLFTWFNVIASWNPFGNTRGLTIAVANTDDGYKSDLIPLRMNIGEQVVSALRANDDFDWVVTSEHNAVDGTKSGKYYAAIVLPPEFSQDMLTFYADGGERTSITFYTNEKKNALAPKITGQGADAVSQDINKVFTQTLSEIAVSILSELSEYLSDSDTQVVFTQLQSHAEQVATQLRAASSNATAFSTLMTSSETLVDSASQLISGTSAALQQPSDALGQAVGAAGSVKGTVTSVAEELSDSISSTKDSMTAVQQKIDAAFAAAQTQTEDQAQVIDAIADQVQAQIDAYTQLKNTIENDIAPLAPDVSFTPILTALDDAIVHQQTVKTRVENAAAALRNGSADAQSTRDALSKAVSDAQQSITDLENEYTTNLKSKLDALATTLTTALSSVGSVGDDLATAAAGLSGSADSINSKLTQSASGLTTLSGELEDAAGAFDTVADALEKAKSAGDLSGLQDIIGADPETLAASLASPVGLDREAVYPVATFGSAMAPLYSVLALWVGALLMSVTITVAVPRGALPGRKELSTNQKYFGRYGIFGVMGLVQSTLLGLGNLVFVGVQSVHPFLYMLAGWVTSLVFTFLIYTAVVAFGNAGKAIGVLFLVVQISGAGAAYPLQLLPAWFQHISKFLPATYAVEAYRAAIAGIYHADYWKALGMLLLFIIPALILGLWVRKPLINFNRGIMEALESTKVM